MLLDAPEFAIFRMICNDPDKAEIVLNRSGYMNRITQAIVVDMKDQVGGLDELLKVASDSNVSLDYIYTSFHRKSHTCSNSSDGGWCSGRNAFLRIMDLMYLLQ